ncbi:Ppx/GppA phosphatase family protein [Nocardioides bruguierae]|uniref:Ppx/GppA phosphatase family protein n=1 Tax=Nocardioides bruguierae TaxID=2945102 RepID=UPI00202162DD|nr:exopolyphosphatase [Nocardioides bruguierae]MCL8027221.1 exopolyphosphatase [Nocardioides bruguierae]
MRVAAVDCGTNTIKLLVLELADDGTPTELVREFRMIRLGEGVDATGRISEAAMARAFAAVEELSALVEKVGGVDRARFCATSASRDAANADVFTAGVLDRFGTAPEVLTGSEEAALSYAGAVRALRTPPAEPTLVFDVGGGSTELIVGRGDTVDVSESMDIGSVRLTERCLPTDPPTPAEVDACVAAVDAALDACDPAVRDAVAAARGVVGVAGTVTTLAAGVLGLDRYDRDAIDQCDLAVTDVHAHCDTIVGQSAEQRRALGWMHPGRADVIGAGAIIVSRVLARTSATRLVVSESDILDGIAWDLALR